MAFRNNTSGSGGDVLQLGLDTSILLHGKAAFTQIIWFKCPDNSGGSAFANIWTQSGVFPLTLGMQLNTSGRVLMRYRDVAGVPADIQIASGNGFDDDVWHWTCVMRRNDTDHEFWIDGVSIGTDTSTTITTGGTIVNNNLHSAGGNGMLGGSLARAISFDRAMTIEEAASYAFGAFPSGAINHVEMNQQVGVNEPDLSGSGVTATKTLGFFSDHPPTRLSNSILSPVPYEVDTTSLNFGASDTVIFGSFAAIEGLTEFTAMQWVKLTSSAKDDSPFVRSRAAGDGGGSAHRMIFESSGQLSVTSFRATSFDADNATDSNFVHDEWQCIVHTWDTTNLNELFIGDENTFAASQALTNVFSGSGALRATSGDLILGNSSAVQTTRNIKGDLAITKYFDKRLSLADIHEQQFTNVAHDDLVLYVRHGSNGIVTDLNELGSETGAITGASLADGLPDLTIPTISAALTGTVTATINETDIVNGGKTIILTLTNDIWVSSGTNFNAQRQNIIDGLNAV